MEQFSLGFYWVLSKLTYESKQAIGKILSKTPLRWASEKIRSSYVNEAEVLSGLHSDLLSGIDVWLRAPWMFYLKARYYGYNYRGLNGKLRKYILICLSGSCEESKVETALRDTLSGLPPAVLSCRSWLGLHGLFSLSGRYTIAAICRSKAKDLALLPLTSGCQAHALPNVSCKNTIAAGIENEQFHSEVDLLNYLEKMQYSKKMIDSWLSFFSLIKHHSNKHIFDTNNSAFFEYIKGRSVAIIGPARPMEDLSPIINQYDVIVRLNYSYMNKYDSDVTANIRTDVTYFNGEQGKAFVEQYGGMLPSDLCWACFKTASHMEQSSCSKQVRMRQMFDYDNFIFNGALNLIPRVILDILTFAPAELKIFYSDLMLTKFRQKNYYSKGLGPSGDTISKDQVAGFFRRTTLLHDPITQYNILKKLWSMGLITGDNRFECVMSEGLDNYLIGIEELYRLQRQN